jgi:hypothetical protein
MNKLTPIYLCKCNEQTKCAYGNRSTIQQYLLGDDAEAAISHAMLDERPGRVPRRVPSADDHISAVRRSISQLVSISIYRTKLAHFTVSDPKRQALRRTRTIQSGFERNRGHPLAVLVVESVGRRGDAEAPPGRELKHPGATTLAQSPRTREGGVGAEALRRRRRGRHLCRLPPESCGHLQETGPRSVRGA